VLDLEDSICSGAGGRWRESPWHAAAGAQIGHAGIDGPVGPGVACDPARPVIQDDPSRFRALRVIGR